jgi:hypothetical protein
MNDSVSIVIPTYNREKVIARSINSILPQMGPDDELIVVDDGSTDNTESVVSNIDTSIVYIRQPNGGAGAARNRGAAASTKDLVAFADSDDEWMSHSLALRRKFMTDHPDVLFCFTDFAGLLSDGTESHRCIGNWVRATGNGRLLPEIHGYTEHIAHGDENIGVTIGDFYRDFIIGAYVNINTLLVRRKQAGDALHNADDVSNYEDWECGSLLSQAGTGAYLDCETCWQHGHRDDFRISQVLSQVPEATANRLKIMARIWGQDEEFLAENGSLYQSILDDQYRAQCDWWIRHLDTQQARIALSRMRNPSLTLKLQSSIPIPVLRLLRWMKRALK